MYICCQAAPAQPVFRDLGRKIVSPTRACREAKLSGRNSIAAMWTIGVQVARLTGKKSWPCVGEPLHGNLIKRVTVFDRQRGLAKPGRLFAGKLAFAGNSLVRFRDALDPILKLAASLGQLPRHHVAGSARVSIREVRRESDSLTRSKLVFCHFLTALLACVVRSMRIPFAVCFP